MNKIIPFRTCVVTKKKYEKSELIRLVKNKDNKISIDIDFNINGRGAYVKRNEKIIAKAIDKKYFNKALRTKKIPEEIIKQLLEIKK